MLKIVAFFFSHEKRFASFLCGEKGKSEHQADLGCVRHNFMGHLQVVFFFYLINLLSKWNSPNL